jgi:rhodanese-related sulfurtransferase
MKKQEKRISYTEAVKVQKNGKGILIDVREPAEYRERHIPHSKNLPSTYFNPEAYQQWSDLKICLVCESGDRARSIARKLHDVGMEEIYVLDKHMEKIQIKPSGEGWSIDRQFRFVLGLFLAIYLAGAHWLSAWFTIIPLILCLGLTITAIIDKCYLRVGIAMMPWNKERRALDVRLD